MTEYELATIRRNSELVIWAGGLAAEAIGILAALAWALPLVMFNTFDRQPDFYAPMLRFGSSMEWGTAALVAALMNALGVLLFACGGYYYRPLRVLGGIALTMFFGAITGTMAFQNWHVPSPYLHAVLTVAAAVATASALVEFTGSKANG